jgi:AraC family transcriptional regulator of adaptative response/methylated-DNA-[protein]-cysteine methyltransferase
MIETAAEFPKLSELAETAGLSRFHFHRLFKSMTGVTPKAYAAAGRNRRFREELAHGKSVTDAALKSGFNSSSRLYASSKEKLGMKPTQFQKGGVGVTIRFAVGESSLGSVLVAATEKGLCALFLGSDPDELVRDLQHRFRNANLGPGDSGFNRWVTAAIQLVEKPGSATELPLDIRGTAFQVRVWEALRRIPCGSTASYTEVAKRIGRPTAARAVAAACAANPIAVAVPCHRVVRTDDSLSGYRWGVERKAELLKREQT